MKSLIFTKKRDKKIHNEFIILSQCTNCTSIGIEVNETFVVDQSCQQVV